jgi:flagellar FliL protein
MGIMATTPPIIQAKIAAEPVKLPVAPLVIAVVVGVVIAVSAVGGVMYFLLRSGKVPIQVSVASSVEPAALTKTRAVVLEPLLVNLADTSGGAYLRAAVTLSVVDIEGAKGSKGEETKAVDKDANAAVRDTVLMVLGRQTSEMLLGADGKDKLKKELKTAIAERNPEIKVSDVFFTEFLVQR